MITRCKECGSWIINKSEEYNLHVPNYNFSYCNSCKIAAIKRKELDSYACSLR